MSLKAVKIIFHSKEESNYYQYRARSVRKNSITLMCIYARNKRANCGALITVLPKRNDLIYAKRNRAGKKYYFI